MRNKDKIIIAVVAVTLMMLIITAVYFYKSARFESLKTEEQEKLEPQTELELQEQVAAIIKTKDFRRCDEMKNALYRTVCVNNIALNLAQETQDISYCQKIDDSLIPISDCERQILFAKSFEKEDISVCAETKDQEIKAQCEENFWPILAVKKEDVSLCENALTNEAKNICCDNYFFQKEFSQNITEFNCDKFRENPVKEDCKYYQANQNKMPFELCQNLKSNLFLDTFCRSNKFRGLKGAPSPF